MRNKTIDFGAMTKYINVELVNNTNLSKFISQEIIDSLCDNLQVSERYPYKVTSIVGATRGPVFAKFVSVSGNEASSTLDIYYRDGLLELKSQRKVAGTKGVKKSIKCSMNRNFISLDDQGNFARQGRFRVLNKRKFLESCKSDPTKIYE